jgi:Zn ribbon nucleic-acid-binding protein
MTVMRIIEGPECPGCGCRDSQILKMTIWFNKKREHRECEHCGRRFTVTRSKPPESPVPLPKPPQQPETPKAVKAGTVEYRPMRTKCPNCGSQKTKVASSRGGLRWHKCRACKHCFKSVDTTDKSSP